jgi:hypothetical protein
MFSLDDHPDPPAIPQFSRGMENYLVSAARTQPAQRATSMKTYVAVGVATAAIAVGAAIGIDHAVTTPQRTTANPRPPQPPNSTNLAAYVVETNPNGTVTLSLAQDQVFNPAALRQDLARAGVPAIVTVGKVCYVAHPPQPAGGQFPLSAPERQADGRTGLTITPSLIPSGAELSVGYFAVPDGGGVHIGLVPTSGPLICTAKPPAPPHH